MRDTLLFNAIWALLALIGIGFFLINIYLGIAIAVLWTIFFYWQVGYNNGNKRRPRSNKQSYKHRSK